jgi:hypothetical protein
MEWTQAYTRERVKVLEMMAELRHLQELRAKREARAARVAVVAKASGLRPETSEPLACSGDVVFTGLDGVVCGPEMPKASTESKHTTWRRWEGGLDRA